MTQPTLFDFEPISGDEAAKSLGAYYTNTQVADFLVWWAIRSGQDLVLDPSFGGGVFLRSACKRILELGGRPAAQVFGAEIDPQVHRRITDKLCDEFGVVSQNLMQGDFFRLEPKTAPRVQALVGNPPFIRYQRFTGPARKRALRCCLDQGVRLPELSSSWAPFLIHSIAMIDVGGRLAMVVPMEIAHARYALPVLEHLRRSFAQVIFLTFRKKLFSELSEDTLLLLADGKGAAAAHFQTRDLSHAGLLASIQDARTFRLPRTRPLDAESIAHGRERLIESLLPKKARALYRECQRHSLARRLGDFADVGIGYVTGANDFFHLAPHEVRHWGIPDCFLKPAVRRGRALVGLRFTADDWRRSLHSGEAGFLLHIDADTDLPEGVRRYLRSGEAQKVAQTYKCRTRSPWFRVPHVHQPDALLSYMSGNTPRLVANEAGAVAPNSLHVLRLHPHTSLTSAGLAALWQTSLTRLSVEIEGHALGGGMLKLEPTEAENGRIPFFADTEGFFLTQLAAELDHMARHVGDESANAHADMTILRKGLGLSHGDCRLLQAAADRLRNRRYSRSANG